MATGVRTFVRRLPRLGWLRWEGRDALLRMGERLAPRSPVAPPSDRPLFLLGPHLDDAVLSCGQLLAAHPGSEVVSVFTGGPPDWSGLTEWDAACGFRPGDDVMAARKREDLAALDVVGARPRWLDLRELQYGAAVSVDEVVQALGDELPAPGTTVLAPLGIHHADHVTLGDAARRLAPGRPDLAWCFYEDLPYRAHHPEELRDRLQGFADAGCVLEPVLLPLGDVRDKRAALRCYRSQVRGLHEWLGPSFGAERYWLLAQ